MFVITFVLLALSSVLAFLQVRLLEPAFDLILVDGNQQYLILIPIGLLLVGIGKGILGYIGVIIHARVNGSISRQLQQEMFARIVSADLAWLRRESSGQILARFGEVPAINGIVAGIFTQFFTNMLLLTAYLSNLFYTNWQLALLSLALVPIAAFPVASLGRKARKISRQQLETSASFTAFLDENIKGVIQIRLYSIEDKKREEAKEMFRRIYKLSIKSMMINGRLQPVMEVLTGATMGLVVWFVGIQIINGESTPGEFASFLLALTLAFRPMKQLLSLNVQLQNGLAGADRVFAVLDNVDTVVTPAKAYRPGMGFVDHVEEVATQKNQEILDEIAFDKSVRPNANVDEAEYSVEENPDTLHWRDQLRHIDSHLHARNEEAAKSDLVDKIHIYTGVNSLTPATIHLKGVRFSYSPTLGDVFSDLDFEFVSGGKNAIVGPTGSGKTTISLLISRLYDVLGGQVLVDGVDVRKWDLHALRSQFSAVTQETGLFDATLEENITLGLTPSRFSLEECLQAACLHEFVAELPLGTGTLVGERGTRLSGGQRQRLSIARAIYRDARVFLMDEATSALDVATELVIQKEFDKATAGKTSIIIAHRLSTVRDADKVFVLKDGRLLESGTHDELYGNDGYYRSLCNVDMRNTNPPVGVPPLP